MARDHDLDHNRDPLTPAVPPPLPPSSPRDLDNLSRRGTPILDDSLSRFHLDAAMQRQLRPLFQHALSTYVPAHYIPAPRYPHGQSFNEYSVIFNIQFFNLTELWFLTQVGDATRYQEVHEWHSHLRPWGPRRIRNTPPETLERQFTFTWTVRPQDIFCATDLMERCDRPTGAPTRRGPDFTAYLTLNDILKKVLMRIKFTWGIFLPLNLLRLRDLRTENHFYNMDMPIYNLVWNPSDEWDQLGPSIIHLVVDLEKPLPPLPPLHTQTLQPPETVPQE